MHWEAYPGHQFIHTIGALPCCATGGCWKSRTVKLNDGSKNDRPENLCVDVVGGLPHCMDMITALEVIRRIELYLAHTLNPSKVPKTLEGLRSGRELPVRKPLRLPKFPKLRKSLLEQDKLTEKNALQQSEQFIHTIPEYPGGFEGRGIVVCAGGVRLFTNAWVCIKMLRHLGCHLPIQLWHLGPGEIDEKMKSLVKPFNVKCIDALELRKTIPSRMLKGWELKAYAVLNCSFKEVLLLDADNVPVKNPEYLFETALYKETGAIFWPDLGRLAKDRAIWKICGVPYRDEPEFETGQLVVNKEICWKPLKLTMWYNEHSDFYYKHIHGDKETFHLAFRKMNKPYSMIPYPVKLRSGVLYQRDFNRKVIFQHRNGHKWNFYGENPRLWGFKYHKLCVKFIGELEQKWNGYITPDFSRKTQKENDAVKQLLKKEYQYQRVGYDQRVLKFLPNGRIGRGKAGCEKYWDVTEKNGEVKLEIYGKHQKTCSLTLKENDSWKGHWMVFEKMPVVLSPHTVPAAVN